MGVIRNGCVLLTHAACSRRFGCLLDPWLQSHGTDGFNPLCGTDEPTPCVVCLSCISIIL